MLEFPQPRVGSDRQYQRAFVREHWIAAEVRSPYVVEVIELLPGRQTRLYTVMPCYTGESLAQRLHRAPPVTLEEGVAIATKLAKAVYALNRMRIVHRDIKPENVLLERQGGLRLLDLGVARLPAIDRETGGGGGAGDIPGTPSYMAPELFDGACGDERTEVYALLGVTLYRMWSGGHFPYGEIEPFMRPRFGRRTPLTRYRPDLPAWLDALIARATAVDPAERHGDAMEFALELEREFAHGPQIPPPPARRPLYERDPLRFWQATAAILAIALLLALIPR